MIWALILAVALYPLHQLVARKLGDRQGLAATLLVVLAIADRRADHRAHELAGRLGASGDPRRTEQLLANPAPARFGGAMADRRQEGARDLATGPRGPAGYPRRIRNDFRQSGCSDYYWG
jgi:hypothetical protein